MYSPLMKFLSQISTLDFGYALQISAFESLLVFINLLNVFSDTAMSPEESFETRTSKQNGFTDYNFIEISTLAFI